MKSNKLIGCLFLLSLLSACGGRTTDYDATGTFEATEVLVSAEASGRLLCFDVEEGTRLASGEEVGLIDTVQLYLKKLQLQASMKSVESQRPDINKQIAATRQQIATAQREKKRVENLLKAGAATLGSFLNHPPTYFLRQGLPPHLELTNLARLAGR